MNNQTLEQAVTQQQQSVREAQAKEIAELKAALEKAKATAKTTLSFKVSQKGAVSVYGMGRFPVTLYKSQWLRLDGAMSDIMAFIEENDADLKGQN